MSLNYNDYAVETAPSSSIESADTSIDVSDNTAYPNPPFLIDVFEGGNSPNDAVKQGGTVERMRVTATSGTGPYTWTVDRDYNGHNGSAQSFSTSAKVWHIQPANSMGPTRSLVTSQASLKPSDRIIAHDDFNRSSLGTAPSGQSWTVDTGAVDLINGYVQSTDGSLARILLPLTFDNTKLYRIEASVLSLGGGTGYNVEFFPFWQDTNNYLRVGLSRGSGFAELTKNISGTSTSLANTSDNVSRFRKTFGRFTCTYSDPGTYFGFLPYVSEGFIDDKDISTLAENANGVAVELEQNTYIESISVYESAVTT